MNPSIKVAALAALLSSMAAFAEDPPKLDTNGDGVISKEEAKANPDVAAKFDEYDTDKNGTLSEAEAQKAQADAKNRRQKRRE